MKEYPEELTFDQFDSIGWDSTKQFGLDDSRPNDDIVKDVLEYAKKTGGQIYTQVDDDDDRLYAKGMRFVNRTGIWEVVHKKGWKEDNS